MVKLLSMVSPVRVDVPLPVMGFGPLHCMAKLVVLPSVEDRVIAQLLSTGGVMSCVAN